MGIAALMQGTGLAGLFATRVFVPMFAAALMMRYGPQIGLIDDWGLLAGVTAQTPPTWFTEDLTLIVLGVLAAAEVFANKSPEARELLNYVDQYGKPLAALATYVGIASVSDQQFVESVIEQAGFGTYVAAAAVAGGTFLVATAHNAIFGGLLEMDEDDDTGVIGLFSWGQDLYALFGIVFLILFPLVMFVLIAMAIGFLFLLRQRAAAKEEQSRIACPTCQQPMYRAALVCGQCGHANPQPTRLNWLGASTHEAVVDRQAHPYHLVAKKRCRRCATRLEGRDPYRPCPTCHAVPFDEPAFVEAYDGMVSARLPLVLVVAALWSLVPVIGLIPGVIYYRLALVSPYRRYLGRGRTFLLRWTVRIVFFFLIMFQWVPLVGGITVPAMALISYLVYRGAFLRSIARGAQAAVQPAPA